jgi:GH24 family phage-related lysozyme (muramidase)
MNINDKGVHLLKSFESCKLKAYKLPGEKFYTIGWGHSFDKSITKDTLWSQEKADSQFLIDLHPREVLVKEIAVKKFPELNANQFSALVSYTYNRGIKGLQQLITNSKTIDEVATNIVVYWGSAVLYKKGLLRRRKAEQLLYCTKC